MARHEIQQMIHKNPHENHKISVAVKHYHKPQTDNFGVEPNTREAAMKKNKPKFCRKLRGKKKANEVKEKGTQKITLSSCWFCLPMKRKRERKNERTK